MLFRASELCSDCARLSSVPSQLRLKLSDLLDVALGMNDMRQTVSDFRSSRSEVELVESRESLEDETYLVAGALLRPLVETLFSLECCEEFTFRGLERSSSLEEKAQNVVSIVFKESSNQIRSLFEVRCNYPDEKKCLNRELMTF